MMMIHNTIREENRLGTKLTAGGRSLMCLKNGGYGNPRNPMFYSAPV
jgi:hypothetical protein